MSKQIQAGPFALTVSAADGELSLVAGISGSAGGGSAAGILKGGANFNIALEDRQAADLAIALLEAKFPAGTAFLELVKAGVDAELTKEIV